MKGLPAVEYLKMIGRLAAREIRDRAPGPRLPTVRVAAERVGLQVTPKHLAAYLAATGGGALECFRGGGVPLPPLYPAVWEARLALEILCHPEMPSVRGGVVHLENETVQLRPLLADDPIRCRVELERAEPDPRGVRLRLLTRTWNAAGQLGSEGRSVMLVRGDGYSMAEPRRPAEPVEEEGWEEVARWRLSTRHGLRYARASGDFNPIHLSRLTALPFGYRRPILHGFCTEAMAANALVERWCGGDPALLQRVRIHFRRPLLLPAAVALQALPAGNRVRFRVVDAEGPVHADGEITTRSPSC